jgi:putative beta-lysine N-acetyltransferase
MKTQHNNWLSSYINAWRRKHRLNLFHSGRTAESDQITQIQDGLIHHGRQNRRLYVMKVPSANLPGFFDRIEQMAVNNRYEKIIVKMPADLQEFVIQRGYESEAVIPGFFKGQTDCVFMGRYLREARRNDKSKALIEDVLAQAMKRQSDQEPLEELAADMICRRAGENDAENMAALYRDVFASYPFPIHDSNYIKKTMRDNVIYTGIWQEDRLIGVASSELDRKARNAEMTDFAVAGDSRGQNLSTILLQQMEKDLRANENTMTLYTIARAVSYGMNYTFARNGYVFGGTLINNTQIAGRIESMNIWYKNLEP